MALKEALTEEMTTTEDLIVLEKSKKGVVYFEGAGMGRREEQ